MKTFKQFITEENQFNKLNNILQQYTNGSMPDSFDNNQPSVKQLFDQLYQVFEQNGVNLIILKDGKRFDGSGIVVSTDTSKHFELASGSEDNTIPQKLHVELKKNENGDYFFSYVKVES